MRTRRACYPTPSDGIIFTIRPHRQKRRMLPLGQIPARASKQTCIGGNRSNPFDSLHDDLLISIMVALSSSANSTADLVNAMLTCRRFCATATLPQVLAHASIAALSLKASKWSDDAHRFLKRCADAGNREACYMLGMIRFYCLMNRGSGVALMAEAAIASHPAALHSLAVIQFNGSGGSRKDKDLKAGVVLCAKAAALGQVDAMRELGHCLQDGYGVKKNVAEGRRYLVEANAREAEVVKEASIQVSTDGELQSSVICSGSYSHQNLQNPSILNKLDGSPVPAETSLSNHYPVQRLVEGNACSLLSDFGCNVPPLNVHVANTFLVEWFAVHPPEVGIRLCSHSKCGRPETRRHEFRRCSACGSVNYCSRACQAMDWKIHHRYHCTPVADWEEHEEIDIDEEDNVEDHILPDNLEDS
eukprot:Gb_35548 [translate_table: standard]